jgi:hypothetical protein
MKTTMLKTSMARLLICALLCIASEAAWADGVWLNIGTPEAPIWAYEPEIQWLYWQEYQRVIAATNQAYAKEPGIIGSYGRQPTNRARFMQRTFFPDVIQRLQPTDFRHSELGTRFDLNELRCQQHGGQVIMSNQDLCVDSINRGLGSRMAQAGEKLAPGTKILGVQGTLPAIQYGLPNPFPDRAARGNAATAVLDAIDANPGQRFILAKDAQGRSILIPRGGPSPQNPGSTARLASGRLYQNPSLRFQSGFHCMPGTAPFDRTFRVYDYIYEWSAGQAPSPIEAVSAVGNDFMDNSKSSWSNGFRERGWSPAVHVAGFIWDVTHWDFSWWMTGKATNPFAGH